ncbi:MAG: hypothetical protein ACPG49_11975 [Chitinophagales bacterium]
MELLIVLLLLFWLTPMIMIFIGAIQMRKNPPKAKKIIIAAGIWLLIGFGGCGLLLIGMGA